MEKVERWLGGRLQDVRAFIDGLYENDLHAKRVDALAGATLGVMTSASLAVAVIARGCRLGWQGGTGAQVARRFGHRIARIQGRRSGLCACRGDEGGLVSCRQQRRGFDRHAGEPLRQTSDCRAKFPRHQGSAVRHGACCDAHRRTNPARPTAAHRCICNAAAHDGRRRSRKPWDGSIAQVQHLENPHALVVQARLHALRLIPTMPDHRLSPLMPRFAETVSNCRSFSGMFEVV
jgi:hypothetical protein